MKATGVVRRIDELGRVVIPKEIRRSLRIKEGDPLEVYIQDGCVVYKKYSPLNELQEFAQKYAEVLHTVTHYIAVVSDNDKIIAVAGTAKRFFMGKPIWNLALSVIEERKTLTSTAEKVQEEFGYFAQIATPIIYEGEVVGVIGLITNDVVRDTDCALLEAASMFLAKQIEL